MPSKFVGLAAAVLLVLVAGSSALAQDESQAGGDEAEESSDESIEQVERLLEREPVTYQITFPRFQAIVVPSFLLNPFFDIHPNNWSNGQTNYAFGGEFIIRRVERFDLVFSVDWADLRTKDDWWMEDGDALVDADWGENSLSLLTFDVAINWLTEIKRYWHFYYGVGLGLAFTLGDFVKTDVDPACISEAGVDPFRSHDGSILDQHCVDAEGNPRLDPNATPTEEDRVPPLIPAITLTAGSRWIIDEDWAIQLEVGFKNIYFYGGLELGYIWE